MSPASCISNLESLVPVQNSIAQRIQPSIFVLTFSVSRALHRPAETNILTPSRTPWARRESPRNSNMVSVM